MVAGFIAKYGEEAPASKEPLNPDNPVDAEALGYFNHFCGIVVGSRAEIVQLEFDSELNRSGFMIRDAANSKIVFGNCGNLFLRWLASPWR